MIDKMAKGIIHLFPACIWTIALAGVILASWRLRSDRRVGENGGSRIVQTGACLLVCFGVVTLGAAAWVGWLTKR